MAVRKCVYSRCEAGGGGWQGPKRGTEEGEEIFKKVLPLLRNINEERVIAKGQSDRQEEKTEVDGGRRETKL